MTLRFKTSIAVVAVLATAAIGICIAGPSHPSAAPPHPSAAPPPAAHARLGIAALPISSELREHFAAPSDRGVLVDRIEADSAAARAGLRVGDVVTDVAGAAVTSARDVRGALRGHEPGDDIAVGVVRDGKPLELHAKLDRSAFAPDSLGELDEGLPFELDLGHGDPQMQRMMDQAREMFRRMQQQQLHAPAGSGGGGTAI